MNLKHNNKLIHEFEDETPEQILEWVKVQLTRKGDLIFDCADLWKLSEDKSKIIHETMVSYTELNLITEI